MKNSFFPEAELEKSVFTTNLVGVSSVLVADGINSVGDYNSPPGGCRLSVCLSVCLSPLFFTFHDWITSKRFELSG